MKVYITKLYPFLSENYSREIDRRMASERHGIITVNMPKHLEN